MTDSVRKKAREFDPSTDDVDDFKVAASLLVIDEVTALLDRLENLELVKLEALIRDLHSNSQPNDPLGLKKSDLKEPDPIDKILKYAAVGAVFFILGGLAVYGVIN